ARRCERLSVAVAHWVEKDGACPGRAPGDHQRGERRLWPLGAGVGEIGTVCGVSALEASAQTGLGIVDVELQRQDRSVACAAIGNRNRDYEHIEAARRMYTLVRGRVTLIRDYASDIDAQVGLLQRGLPQAEAREDERGGGDNCCGGLATSELARAAHNLVRALARPCAVSPKPCHAGLPNSRCRFRYRGNVVPGFGRA